MGEFPLTYTNWGPVTRSITSGTHEKSFWIKLGSLFLRQRKLLENMAAVEPVKVPISPGWNCQDWTKSVLRKAVREGLFTKTVVSSAIERMEVCVTLHSAILS